MLDAQIIESAQRRPGKIAKFRVVALSLKLTYDNYWNNHLVFFKFIYRARIS
jgi:hypothetical protein